MYLVNAAVVLTAMLCLWLVSLKLHDVSIVDIAWGPVYAGVALVSLLQAGEPAWRARLLVAMTLLWGLRLGAYLLFRSRGAPEDRRYAKMRENTPGFAWKAVYQVFLLQGLLVLIVSMPLQWAVASGSGGSVAVVDLLGVPLFLVGVFFEAVGDWQLARFRADPANKGKVLKHGLWRYTRHPNYFGDFCVWWGLYLVALAGGAPWWTGVGPLVMSVLLLKVSGVTLLEKDIQERRPAYEQYVRSTNAFFPGPPRRAAAGS